MIDLSLIASLLTAALYQGKHNSKRKLENIVSSVLNIRHTGAAKMLLQGNGKLQFANFLAFIYYK